MSFGDTLVPVQSNIVKQLETTTPGTYVRWPKDVILYQPFETEQIILPEFASCLAVRTYLNMCQLPYEIKYLANAEYMADSGRLTKLPVLRIGNQIVAEFEPIVRYINALGHGLRHKLKKDDQNDMETLISYVENIFTLSELWFCYKEPIVYQLITAPRIGMVYPWPLSCIQRERKFYTIECLFKTYEWSHMNIEQVLKQVRKCCEILTEKMLTENGSYFFAETPSELDALVFGHLFAIVTTTLPNMELAKLLLEHKALIEFTKFVDGQHYKINKD